MDPIGLQDSEKGRSDRQHRWGLLTFMPALVLYLFASLTCRSEPLQLLNENTSTMHWETHAWKSVLCFSAERCTNRTASCPESDQEVRHQPFVRLRLSPHLRLETDQPPLPTTRRQSGTFYINCHHSSAQFQIQKRKGRGGNFLSKPKNVTNYSAQASIFLPRNLSDFCRQGNIAKSIQFFWLQSILKHTPNYHLTSGTVNSRLLPSHFSL